MEELLFTDVHDIVNYFQQKLEPLEILHEQELASCKPNMKWPFNRQSTI